MLSRPEITEQPQHTATRSCCATRLLAAAGSP